VLSVSVKGLFAVVVTHVVVSGPYVSIDTVEEALTFTPVIAILHEAVVEPVIETTFFVVESICTDPTNPQLSLDSRSNHICEIRSCVCDWTGKL